MTTGLRIAFLPLTDAAVGPDGALYFTIGGRGAQSELYRVTYIGKESTSPVKPAKDKFAAQRQLRRSLEQFHDANFGKAGESHCVERACHDRGKPDHPADRKGRLDRIDFFCE